MTSAMENEFNAQLVDILQLSGDPLVVYAARRIKELEYKAHTLAENNKNGQEIQDQTDQALVVQKKLYEDLLRHKDYAESELLSNERILRKTSQELEKYQDAFDMQVKENQREAKLTRKLAQKLREGTQTIDSLRAEVETHLRKEVGYQRRFERQGKTNDKLTTQLIQARAEQQDGIIGTTHKD